MSISRAWLKKRFLVVRALHLAKEVITFSKIFDLLQDDGKLTEVIAKVPEQDTLRRGEL